MAEDVYRRLAKKLDERPHGFPTTENGVEIEILKRIFSPDEAEMALKMKPVPETAEAIAQRLEKPVPEMQSILDDMARKGQIGCLKLAGQQVYMFIPLAIGISSFQIRMDKEDANLFGKYAPALFGKVGGFKPALSRVIPVNAKIEAKSEIYLYEDLHQLIDQAKSFRVRECICRKRSALSGKAWKHTLETCLSISQEEGAFDYFSLAGRIISKEEAFKILSEAEKEGLVHCVSNVQKGHAFVCNCCPCCSAFLRPLKEFKTPYMLAKSNFVARIDRESCTSCGVCKEERCPMEAIVDLDGSYKVLGERCIGCGTCTVTCPTDSITMEARPDLEREEPPANLVEWNVKRAASRGIELKV
jgi:Na+-translocating ferredoxin:NAD+ oxidoreductase subunit B